MLERFGIQASYRLFLDREGSVVWSLCDGKARVHDVIEQSLRIVGQDEETWTPRVCHYLMLLARRRCLSLDRT